MQKSNSAMCTVLLAFIYTTIYALHLVLLEL